MIGSTRAVRVFARNQPTDLRAGFDRLYGLVRQDLGKDPLAGDLYLFVSRDRRAAKVLHWDGTGLCVDAKRLARGQFARLWDADNTASIGLTASELALFQLLDENAVLLAKITELTQKLAEATDREAQLLLELQLKGVQEQLAALNKEKYGPSRSERRGRPETGEVAKDTAAGKEPPKAQTGHGPTAQPTLPVVDVTHVLDEADRTCPKCGDALVEMRGQSEDSETISVERVKYVDHLPLENQVDRMVREGLAVTSQTLFDQLYAAVLVLLPTYLANKKRVLSQDHVHVDETPWRLMGKWPSARWWVWTVTSAAGTHFDILPTRGAMGARKVLDGYDGVVVADGYGVYASLEGALTAQGGAQTSLDKNEPPLPDFTLAGCWSHARRPFVKSEGHVPEAKELLDLVAKLYAIQDEAVTLAGDDVDALLTQRRRLREEKSRGVIAEMEEPDIPLDHNAAERAIRCPVRGRKAHLGSHSVRGILVAAVLDSLFGSCRQAGAGAATL